MLNEIKSAIADAGFLAPSDIVLDGNVHRFASDANKKGKKDGWYVGTQEGGTVFFNFGSWRSGETKKLKFKTDVKGSVPNVNVKRPRPSISDVYGKATDAAGHPYLVRKGIKCPDGVKRIIDLPASRLGVTSTKPLNGLIIPMYNITGIMSSIQYIPDVSSEPKLFAGGLPVAGLFFVIGGKLYGASPVCVVEGLATGASVYEATGIVTVVAFSASNIKKVVSQLFNVLDDNEIIVCRDNDPAGEKSVNGLSCRVDCPKNHNDFNDMHKALGLEEVRKAVLEAVVLRASKPVVTTPGILTSDGSLIRIAEAKAAFGVVPEAAELLLRGTGFCDDAIAITGGVAGGECVFDPHALEEFFVAAKRKGWTGLSVVDADIELQSRRTFNDVYERWAIAMIEGSALFVDRHYDATGFDGWSLRYSSIGAASKVFGNLRSPEVLESKDGSVLKWVNVFEKWMHSRARHTYTEFGFAPLKGKVAAPGYRLEPGNFLNLYGGLTFRPVAGDCLMILDHILDIWCYGDIVVYDYVIKWLASVYQKPGERGHTAIALKSNEGAGKNIILDPLIKSFGRHGLMLGRSDDVTGRFNDALATSVLVFLNEAVWGGDKKNEGVLKILVTDEMLRCERKFLPAFNVRNCTHVIVASNHDWVVPVGKDDRRWFVLDVSDAVRGKWKYFDELAKSDFSAFIHYLLHLDLSGFNPRDIPEGRLHASVTKADNKLRSADTATQWWDHVTQTGTIYIEGEKGPFPTAWEEESLQFQKELAYRSYMYWCKDSGRRVELIGAWTRTLKSLGVDTKDSRVTNDVGVRVRAFWVGTLGDTRKILLDKLGLKADNNE